MAEFKIKFRGVRGSYPVANKDFLEYGGNTSCVEVYVGGHLIVLDAGTGIISTGNDLVENYLTSCASQEQRKPIKSTILLSHIHQDHIQGLTFFKPLHMKSSKINVFGQVSENENLMKELSNILFGKAFPLDFEDVVCDFEITNLPENHFIVFKENSQPFLTNDLSDIEPNDVVVEYYKSYAHPQDGVVIYKITYQNKVLVYATDKESYLGGDKKLINFARNCDVIIHDSQYTTEDYQNQFSPKQGYGHSTFEIAKDLKPQINAKKLIFFHYDPQYNDNKLNKIKEQYPTCVMAKENLTIDLFEN